MLCLNFSSERKFSAEILPCLIAHTHCTISQHFQEKVEFCEAQSTARASLLLLQVKIFDLKASSTMLGQAAFPYKEFTVNIVSLSPLINTGWRQRPKTDPRPAIVSKGQLMSLNFHFFNCQGHSLMRVAFSSSPKACLYYLTSSKVLCYFQSHLNVDLFLHSCLQSGVFCLLCLAC